MDSQQTSVAEHTLLLVPSLALLSVIMAGNECITSLSEVFGTRNQDLIILCIDG